MHVSARNRATMSSGLYTYTSTAARSEQVHRGDRVTISPEARELHRAAEQEHEVEAELERYASEAHEGGELDDAHAAVLARVYAYGLDREQIDRSEEIAGTGPARYTATGAPVTRESERLFAALARDIRARRIALYEAEVAAGTAPLELLRKLVDFTAQQPAEYRATLELG
jgi:hypothetical protein